MQPTQHSPAARATTTSFAISSIGSGNLLKTTTGGAIIAATAGTDYATVAQTTNFHDWAIIGGAGGYLTPTSTIQSIIASASSTIGSGTQAGGLTISGGATTTGNQYIAGTLSVGTTSPWGLLSINPTSALGTAPAFVIGSSTDTSFIITNAGRVGIGTTSPQAQLAILGADGTGTSKAPLALLVQSGVGGSTAEGGDIAFITGNAGSGDSFARAGNLIFTGGVGGALTTGGGPAGAGGGLVMTGGTGGASTGAISAGTGGGFNFTGGTGGDGAGGFAAGQGGHFTFTGGNAPAGPSSSNLGGGFTARGGVSFGVIGAADYAEGGLLTVAGGWTGASSVSGLISLTGGSAKGGGGPIRFTTGAATSTGSAGLLSLIGGIASSSTANATGGTINLTGGAASSTVSTVSGGSINLTGGSGGTGTQTVGSGGSVTINGGAAGIAGGSVGNVILASQRGLVGIASTSPYALLSLHASSTATNQLLFAISSSTSAFATTSLFSISNTGLASTTNLVVSGLGSTGTTCVQANAAGLLSSAGAACSSGSGTFSFIPTTNYGATANSTSTPIWFQAGLQASSTSHFTNLDYTGTLGFATSSSNASSTIFTFNGQSFIVASTSNGTVGGNTGLGIDVLSSITSGDHNTALGYQALLNATSTTRNTGVGYRTLSSSNLSGSSNNAFGSSVLANNTSGNSNNAFGIFALGSNTTGSNNNAFGYSALFSNTTGSWNSAFGEQSGGEGSIGNFNSTFGAFSLYSEGGSSAIANNSAFGAQASQNNDNPIDTVAVGYAAALGLGFLNRDVDYYSAKGYTALGFEAGFNFGNGADYNTLVGYQSGYNISTGYANIGIGASSTANITTGDGNIGIGNNTFLPSATGNNQLNIGGILFGSLPATSTAFKEATAGTIGVASSSPWAKLSIHANNGSTNTMLFAIGSSTASATTTLFTVDNTGTASTTGLVVSNTGGSGTRCLQVDSSGAVSANSSSCSAASGFSFPFTPTTNFGATANSTSTAVWFQAGLQASSTANLVNTNIYGKLGFVSTSSDVLGQLNGATFLQATTSSANGILTLGYQAGNALLATSTGSGTGPGNIAIGYQALLAATSSVQNTAIGFSALINTKDYSNGAGFNGLITNSGSRNTAVGWEAMYANISGSLNTAVGMQVLAANTTGSTNVAFGDLALTGNTTGSSNSGFGNQTLHSNTGGSANTALGFNALWANTNANNSIAVGYQAAAGNYASYSSQGFTVVGYNAGYNFANGSDYNTLLGYQSGSAITSGYGNLLLGPSVTASNLQTGHGNIGLGNEIFFPTASTNNTLNLGGLLFGSLPATSTAFAEATAGTIGIASSSPWAKLSVHANNGSTNMTLFAVGSSTASATTTLFSIANTGLVTVNQGKFTSSMTGLDPNGPLSSQGYTNGTFSTQLASGQTYGPITGLTVNTSGTSGNATTTVLYGINVTNDLNYITVTNPGVGNDVVGLNVANAYTTKRSDDYYGVKLGGLLVDSNGRFDNYYGVRVGTTETMNSGKILNSYGLYVEAPCTGSCDGGNIYSSYGLYLEDMSPEATGATSTYAIYSSGGTNFFGGRVGVGTTSPTARLHIFADTWEETYTSLFAISSTTGTATSTLFSVSNTGLASTTNLVVSTLGSSGTTCVQVNAAGLLSSAGAACSSGSGTFSFTPTTNFGALANSTSTPIWFQAGLQASSTSHFTNLDYTGTLGFATSSTNASSTIFTFNGRSFIVASTTNASIKGANTGLGLDVLSNTTSGARNTALGYQALQFNTSGNDNIALGWYALKYATSSTLNVAIGNGALSDDPGPAGMGSKNIAVGYYSLGGTTGTENISIGTCSFSCGGSNTPGSYNIGLGQFAADYQTAGSHNIGIGHRGDGGSLPSYGQFTGGGTFGSGITGFGNVAIGDDAFSGGDGATQSIGNYNVALGYGAGLYTGTGSGQNVYLGAFAGGNINSSAPFETLSSNNIAIGYNALLPATTSNNTLNIGNFLFGTLPATTTNTLGGTAVRFPTTGAIGIASTSPWGTLSIHANNGSTNTMLFAIGSSTQSATTSLFSISNTGLASTTGLVISNTGGSGTRCLQVGTDGTVSANSSSCSAASGFSFPFTPTTNYGALANSTSTPIWFQAGLQASSTSHFTNLDYTGTLGFATSSTNASSTIFTFNGRSLFNIASTSVAGGSNGGNTGLGLDSLSNITSGYHNTAVGYQALPAVTSSPDNSAFGYQALKTFTTGNGNGGSSAFGAFALTGLTNGVGATAVGSNALQSLTTGSYNTAVGANAGYLLIGGSSNSSFGRSALGSQQGGSFNTAVGERAATGGAVYSASGITAIGFNAGSTTLSGANNNTFIGYQSGVGITTGYGNTLLGAFDLATGNTTNITTGFGNLGLGYNAFFSSTTANNQLNIGNLVYGTLPATSTAFAEATAGTIGIASSSPWAKLSVHANNGSTNTMLFAIGSSTASATTTLFTVSNTGTVGINNPDASALASGKLVVRSAGTDTFVEIWQASDLSWLGGIYEQGDGAGSLVISNASGDNNVNLLGNTGKSYIKDGQFGFGSTSPFAKLSLHAQNGETNTTLFAIGSSTASATTTLFTITNAGNVGIGTTSPYARLSVVGPVVAEYFHATSTAATSTFAGGFNVGGGALVYDYSGGLTTIQNLAIGTQNFEADSGIISWIDMAVTSAAATGTVESYTAQIDGTSVLTVYSVSDGMGGIWSPSVGIGTSTPWATLSVEQQATSTPVFVVADTGSSTPYLIVSSYGHVGISTTSPYRQLSVGNSAVFGGDILAAYFTATSTTASTFPYASSTAITVSGTASTTNLVVSTLGSSGTTCVQVNAAGLLSSAGAACSSGSGTFSFTPTTNYGALANSTSTPIWFQAGLQASSTSHFENLDYTGTLGFATSSTNASSTIFTFNGRSFIIASTTTGTKGGNTGVGLDVLSNVTSGYRNTALGYQALLNATSSRSNTAVGFQALRGEATSARGSYNSAFGDQALYSNTRGGENSAFGPLALFSNTDGGGNVAFGGSSGSSWNGTLGLNTTGNYNTALGKDALSWNVSGSSNVAVGYAASASILSATNTVAVGAESAGGFYCCGGDSFGAQGYTIVGYHAGYKIGTNSDYNTLFGYQSGSKISTGYGNILLGPSVTENNLTTGRGNILIGYNAFATSSSAVNTLNIGGILFGNLPATSTAFAEATAGTIGIASTSPFATLSIHANNGSTNMTLFAVGSSTASATTTLFTITNTGVASTTNLTISGTPGGLLKTDTSGAVSVATAGTDYATVAQTTNFHDWAIIGGASGYLTPTSTIQSIIASASSTIGGGTQAGGLTISGGATTTLNAYFGSNVGIGTTTPWGLLSINPTSSLGSIPALVVGSSTATNFIVTSSGKVGIGTDNPTAKLEINGDQTFTGFSTAGGFRTISVGDVLGAASVAGASLNIIGGQASCFLAGTQVTLADGSTKNIEDITVGEKVLSYDESTQQQVASEVTTVFDHTPSEMTGDYYLIVMTQRGAQIKVTINHPIYSAGTWKLAGDLVVGDTLLNDKDEVDAVASIQKVYDRVPTYNFEVDINHVYYAEGLLVHNKPGGGPGGSLYLTGGGGSNANGGGSVYIWGGSRGTPGAAYGNVILGVSSTTGFGVGNVGVGTSSPFATFSIHASSSNTTLFAIGSSTAAFATSTLFSITNTGLASSTNLIVSGLGSSGTTCVQANAAGLLSSTGSACGAGGSAFPFTPGTSYGVAVQSTSTPLALTAGVFASSTSHFTNLDYTGTLGFATSSTNASSTLFTFNGRSFIVASTSPDSNTGGNTGVGLDALSNITNGRLNTAFGYQALLNATSSSFNTAIGYLALKSIVKDDDDLYDGYNTAVGANALTSNTTGNNNTAVGTNVLFQNTTGESNSAFGAARFFGFALAANTTGNDNAAFGGAALGSNTTGGQNTAVGTLALGFYTTGSGNTALGYGAGSAFTPTGPDHNTLLGFSSGSAVTGYGNTLVGASVTANNLSDGHGNVGLGNEIFFPSESSNNTLNVGNILFGTIPATSTAFKEATTGTIGIASSSPFAKLSVHANNGSTNTTLFAIGSSTASATTTHFVVTNTGRVGIGTTSPTAIFGGTFASAGPIFIGGSPTTATSTFEGNARILGTLQVGAGSVYLSETGVTLTNNSTFNFSQSGGQDISFNTDDLVIDTASGNLGVSSTTPWGRLSVDTTGLAAGVPSFVVGSSTRTDFIVTQAGRVGIGTTSPSAQLTISNFNVASTSDSIFFDITMASTTGPTGFPTTTPTSFFRISYASSTEIFGKVIDPEFISEEFGTTPRDDSWCVLMMSLSPAITHMW